MLWRLRRLRRRLRVKGDGAGTAVRTIRSAVVVVREVVGRVGRVVVARVDVKADRELVVSHDEVSARVRFDVVTCLWFDHDRARAAAASRVAAPIETTAPAEPARWSIEHWESAF